MDFFVLVAVLVYRGAHLKLGVSMP